MTSRKIARSDYPAPSAPVDGWPSEQPGHTSKLTQAADLLAGWVYAHEEAATNVSEQRLVDAAHSGVVAVINRLKIATPQEEPQ